VRVASRDVMERITLKPVRKGGIDRVVFVRDQIIILGCADGISGLRRLLARLRRRLVLLDARLAALRSKILVDDHWRLLVFRRLNGVAPGRGRQLSRSVVGE
jgi:hypothetical protein